MNMNRLRPTKGGDLSLWLSGVIHDAIRDAKEAGLSSQTVYDLLKIITESEHPVATVKLVEERR